MVGFGETEIEVLLEVINVAVPVGTDPVDQLEPVLQSLDVAPVHVAS